MEPLLRNDDWTSTGCPNIQQRPIGSSTRRRSTSGGLLLGSRGTVVSFGVQAAPRRNTNSISLLKSRSLVACFLATNTIFIAMHCGHLGLVTIVARTRGWFALVIFGWVVWKYFSIAGINNCRSTSIVNEGGSFFSSAAAASYLLFDNLRLHATL